MSFAWQEYLVFAEAVLDARTTLAPEEACCRAAISRAYYAVYGTASTEARGHAGLQLSATGDAHQIVMTHYLLGPTPLHRAIGANLRRLRAARNRADYNDQMDQPVPLAIDIVRRARQTLTQIQALATRP
jgi:hypothetical protein